MPLRGSCVLHEILSLILPNWAHHDGSLRIGSPPPECTVILGGFWLRWRTRGASLRLRPSWWLQPGPGVSARLSATARICHGWGSWPRGKQRGGMSAGGESAAGARVLVRQQVEARRATGEERHSRAMLGVAQFCGSVGAPEVSVVAVGPEDR
ncbi:hypothetical protein NDU88_001359 [Pleurodeles waltl]|uniref:Uncharacterized protein n=1 Tax=Pleurodeles waltl TaxID=8319 RepID=A0AAV7TIF9_PLEWA|nr:hypothetical protein NDU88_001359 [Pleurodeles waltl]